MYRTLPLLFAAGTMAQSTITTTWFAGGFENNPVASVIGADSTAVTYSVGCSKEDIDNDECGMAGGFTVTAGPSIFEFEYTDALTASDYTADFSMSESCDLSGTTMAVCVESAGGSEANFPGVSTETLTGTDVSWGTLYITAGFDNLAAATGASASGSQASATGSSASATGSAAQSGSRTSSGATQTGTAASSTGKSPIAHRIAWESPKSTTSASHSGSASGSAASASATGGAARFAVPVAGVAGVLAAALAL
ncbi:gpi anchored [Neofusicoccum parvum]|uniref:Gpi anchored n=1 Tax=Neofusicoccum parvum TaxID=310453 RepID=A0ACB5RZZ7_9PEZI|nr:gpi anchored [Neofusicoccum parvum]